MADIPYIQAALEVKITGQDSTGDTVNYVSADANGNMLVKDYSAGPVIPGTVAPVSTLIGAQFNTALPTLTNTQQSAVQLDSSGRIIISPLTNVSVIKAQLQDNAGSAIILGQTTMSASIPVVIASNQSAIPIIHLDSAPATQNITAFDASTTSLVGANGQVFYFGTPTAGSSATYSLSSIAEVSIEGTLLGAGGTMVIEVSMDGGTFWLRPNVYQISTQSYSNSFTAPYIAVVNVSGMSNIRVRGITSWTGTATILIKETINQRTVTILDALPPGTNTIGNIANISGIVSLPTGASTSANQSIEITSLQLIDNPIGSVGAGTAGTSSFLIGGVFNTTLPTLTNGQQSATQLDSSGRSLVNVSTSSNNTDFNGSGTIAALNGTVTAITNGCSSVTFDVTGTWVATIVIEATTGDGTWFIVNGDVDVTDSIASSFTVNTFVTIPCGSFSQVRLRASLYTSGTATISWNASSGTNVIEIFNTNPTSLIATVRLQDASGNNINSLSNGLNTNTKTILTPSSPTSAIVGVASGLSLAANANRKGLILTNTSKNTISFGLGVAAVLNSGITLTPNGNWIMDEFNFTTAAINSIASAASSNLAIQEFTT